MRTHHPDNERSKRQYFVLLKEAKGQSEASVDAVAKAIARIEADTQRRDFKAFHFEQAMAFKRRLADREMRHCAEAAQDASLPDELFDPFTPDDPEEYGYAASSPVAKAITEHLLAEAQALGIDTEALKEDAARHTEGQTEDIYHAQLQEAIRSAVTQTRAAAGRSNARTAEPGSQDSGPPAGPPSAERSDGANGPDTRAERPTERPALDLTAPTKAQALEQQAALEWEQADREAPADQPKSKLTGEQPDMFNTQGGLFAQQESKVYTVNEPSEISRDLFPESLPDASGRDRGRKPTAKSGELPAPNAVSVRQDAHFPGLYHTTSQLVEVGKRDLPVALVKTWDDAAKAFGAMTRFAVEHFDALVTDKNGKPLAIIGSFKGAQSQTSVYPSTILGELARMEGATDVWAVHNHPSGEPMLSRADEHLAQMLDRMIRRESAARP